MKSPLSRSKQLALTTVACLESAEMVDKTEKQIPWHLRVIHISYISDGSVNSIDSIWTSSGRFDLGTGPPPRLSGLGQQTKNAAVIGGLRCVLSPVQQRR